MDPKPTPELGPHGGDWIPPSNAPPPPKSTWPPGMLNDYFRTAAEEGKAIPLVYGTARVSLNEIERFLYTFQGPGTVTGWPVGTAVVVGQFCGSNGGLYVCTQAGVTSGAYPFGQGLNGTGAGIVDNTAKWDFVQWGYRHFVAYGICEGSIFGVLRAWQDKNVYTSWTQIPHDLGSLGGVALSTGAANARPGWFVPTPNNDLYGDTAVLWIYQNTASDQNLPNTSVEVQGIFADGTHADVNPADVAIDLLTHTRRGAAWPTGRVDSVSTGSGVDSWRTYCTALGLNISWAIESQLTAMALLTFLLTVSNTDAVWTNRVDGLGGMLKFVPRGDQAVTANGVTYTPNTTPLYNLDNTSFLGPVQIRRISSADTYNNFVIEYCDRASDYKRITRDDPDMSDVDIRGLKKAPTVALPFVLAPDTVMMLSRIFAQRSLNIRNEYTFELPFRFIHLEPTDLVTISDTVSGLVNVPVKITAIQEDQGGDNGAGSFQVTAVDWPAAVGTAAKYTPQAGDGFKPAFDSDFNNYLALPGTVGVGVVTDSTSSRGGDVDNLWPNPTSEKSGSGDTTSPEFAARVQLATDAFSGTWVRQISTAIHAPVRLGDQQTSPTTDQSQLGAFFSCSPGDQFYIEAMAKIPAGASGEQAGVYVWFLDANNNYVGGPSTFTPISASSSLHDVDSFLTNGGGETGTVGAQAPSWTLGAGNGLLIANDFAHSGVQSLKITHAAAASSFSSQDVALVGGQEYTLSGWLKTSAIAAAAAGIGTYLNVDIVSGITSFTIVQKLGVGADPNVAQPDVGIQADGAAHDWTFVKCRFVPATSGTIRVFCQLGYNASVIGSAWFDDVKLGPSFTKVSAFGTAPAAAAKVMLGLWVNCTLGAVTAQWDAIYARRADLAPLDHARTTISPYILSTGWSRLLRALDGDASTTGTQQAGLAWYRGQIDPTRASAGAPEISNADGLGERIIIQSPRSPAQVTIATPGGTQLFGLPLQIQIQPRANTDNLDALRRMEMVFFDSAGVQAGGTITEQLSDRAYFSPSTPGNGGNGIFVYKWFWLTSTGGAMIYGFSPFFFNGFLRVYIWNAYGFAARDYGQAPNSSATWAVTTIGGSTPSPSAGGGSSYCPAPEALILMEDGTTKYAYELRDGMRVRGVFADNTPGIGVIRYVTVERALSRYLITLQDGRQLRFSRGHQLYSVTRDTWLDVQHLRAGEQIRGGQTSIIVASVREDGPGPVVGFIVEDTHTYFADGVLCHNAKAALP